MWHKCWLKRRRRDNSLLWRVGRGAVDGAKDPLLPLAIGRKRRAASDSNRLQPQTPQAQAATAQPQHSNSTATRDPT
eukprot:4659584-Prymnesium_polylepis.3